MPAQRPFRFLAAFQAVVDGQTLAAEARRAEAMGFTAMVVPDHLIEQLSPIPALATIAAATDRLRIGAFVHNNALRHPAVLAQEEDPSGARRAQIRPRTRRSAKWLLRRAAGQLEVGRPVSVRITDPSTSFRNVIGPGCLVQGWRRFELVQIGTLAGPFDLGRGRIAEPGTSDRPGDDVA